MKAQSARDGQKGQISIRRRFSSRPGLTCRPRTAPDMESWKKNTKLEAFMWPCMNLEDLKKTRDFLVLPNARNIHEPREFVLSGLKQAVLGETIGVNAPAFLDEYILCIEMGEVAHRAMVSLFLGMVMRLPLTTCIMESVCILGMACKRSRSRSVSRISSSPVGYCFKKYPKIRCLQVSSSLRQRS